MRGRIAPAFLAGFVVLLVAVSTHWSPLQRLDQDVADGLNRAHVAVRVFEIVSVAGRPISFQLLAVGVALVLWRLGRAPDALAVAVTVLLAPALTNLVKVLVARPRPVVPDPVAHAPGLSFPSGHALASIVAVIVLVGLRPHRVLVTLGTLVVALIGFARLALGVHYLSDVVAGWLLGTVWALLAPSLIVRATTRRSPAAASPDRPRGTPRG